MWPSVQEYDRGCILEDQWKTLNISFEELRDHEATGQLPSLIVSPMIVENGRRLLFSNLDLGALTETRSGDPPGVSGGPTSRQSGRLYSRSSVEFFRLSQACKFPIKTAIRMNGSFPYISPAVSLPTSPNWRIVNAGYYDNYGVNLAMTWAYNNREWIREITSGLALIQIRAYESEKVRKSLRGIPPEGPAGRSARIIRGIARGLQAFTSPLEGAGSAMAWSMSYRNDEQIRELDNYFNAAYQIKRNGQVVTVHRQRSAGGSDPQLMSWGDGSCVPTSNRNLVIAGTDGEGLLHIRTFDPAGIRNDIYEKKMEGGTLHVITEGPSGTTDMPESSLTAARAQAIAGLKQQLSAWLPSHDLSDAEEGPGCQRGDINHRSDPRRATGLV